MNKKLVNLAKFFNFFLLLSFCFYSSASEVKILDIASIRGHLFGISMCAGSFNGYFYYVMLDNSQKIYLAE